MGSSTGNTYILTDGDPEGNSKLKHSTKHWNTADLIYEIRLCLLKILFWHTFLFLITQSEKSLFAGPWTVS